MLGYKSELTCVLCWTRMQAEAGQDIQAILHRKEIERKAGGGSFFWGIGNAPSKSIRALATEQEDVDVVFSLMKSRPKRDDVTPVGIVVWDTYFDLQGVEKPLPAHALVTSKLSTATNIKRAHYALMCMSNVELKFGDHGSFDPTAYRNLSEARAPIGNSQVTALVVRAGAENGPSEYRVNLRAKLTGSFWVKLGRPRVVSTAAQQTLATAFSRTDTLTSDTWFGIVEDIRRCTNTQTVFYSLF